MRPANSRLLYPPIHAELFETSISTHWLDENGFLCTVSKKVERRIEHYYEIITLYQSLTGKFGKLCVLVDLFDSMPFHKEIRDLMIAEFPKYVKAHAIVSKSSFNSAQTSIFIQFNFLDYPTKVFSDVEEAREWLKEFN
jgi:hypothetical protein